MKNNFLTALPFAHRGLYDNNSDSPENTMAAFQKAIDAGFAIECDVKLSSDNEVVVFHDDTLLRLCGRKGKVEDFSASELSTYHVLNSQETIPKLSELLNAIDGRVPIVVELKSFSQDSFCSDTKLELAVLKTIQNYTGDLALKSFNPLTVEFLKSKLHIWPVGFLSCNYSKDDDLKEIAKEDALAHTNLTSKAALAADFISYGIDDLTSDISLRCKALKKPIMVWTVRTKEQFLKARELADNIVFEWASVQHNWKQQKTIL